jgi:hypothetical protein
MDISFSTNIYDKDGDCIETCLLVYFDNKVILKLQDLSELKNVIKKLEEIKTEIELY